MRDAQKATKLGTMGCRFDTGRLYYDRRNICPWEVGAQSRETYRIARRRERVTRGVDRMDRMEVMAPKASSSKDSMK